MFACETIGVVSDKLHRKTINDFNEDYSPTSFSVGHKCSVVFKLVTGWSDRYINIQKIIDM